MSTENVMILTAFASVIVLLQCVLVCNTYNMGDELDFAQFMKILEKPRVLDRYKKWQEYPGKVSSVSSFSWSDCGAASDPAHLTNLTLKPDPLVIPGDITVSVHGSLDTPLEAPLEVSLKLEKKVVFWITIPCIDDVGSCDYSDICALIAQVKCPPDFAKYGLPCKCPIKAGKYNIPPVSVPVNPVGVPSWLSEGDYKITATIKSNKKEVACVHFDLSIKA